MSEGTAKKEERRKFQAIKGTRDLLPPETARWNRVEQTAQEVFTSYGFAEIRLPIFEATDLFARSIGGETDIVGKEMYSFPAVKPQASLEELVNAVERAWQGGEIDNTPENQQRMQEFRDVASQIVSAAGDATAIVNSAPQNQFRLIELNRLVEAMQKSFSLRPEATASVCRAYIENGMQQLPQPVKLYTIGPMFRRERPQKGRYRQFYQIDAEVLGGSDAPGIDAELIEMVMAFFARLGLEGVELDINCIGDKKCRPEYVEMLRAELRKVKDKLGPDSQRRIETNPLRVLDSKLENEQKLIEGMPHIADHLCEECAENYRGVKKELELRGVKYRENWRLVRGLDYYSRTTFEITAKGLGSQNAVCGGGRYDGLIELLGGPPTRATGFAIGEDRLILSLQEAGKTPAAQGRDVYIAWMGEKAYASAVHAAKTLRAAGFSVELPPVEQKFGKALGQADKLGARYALILGDNEVESGEWTVKTLATGEQAKVSEASLLEFLRK
ncbi:MAG TPA: histidine--tRNA ligase [Candidatus Acidoferrum sp.]|nr:histidine--tRNA ligase [Candidatus Acidoferrum sp.]